MINLKGFLAFTKKEILENIRSYKLLIVLIIFAIFGLLNPITALITPEVLKSILPVDVDFDLPNPTAIDSWAQFYKNISTQMIIFYIIFAGIVSSELSKGTLTNILTKGLDRKYIIISKLLVMNIIWTLSYFLCYLLTLGYTFYLFPNDLSNLFVSGVLYWVFGLFMNTVLVFGSTLSDKYYVPLLVVGGTFVLIYILDFIPNITFSPYKLISENLNIINQVTNIKRLLIPLIVTIILSIGTLFITILTFNKKEL